MKRTISAIALVGLMSLGLNTGEASAAKKPGNGNDGCQIGNIPGHKDHGQSNEHKIDYMTKAEWEAYLIANGFEGQQMSNNEGSNGWITYHIYKDGKQIEVVHIRFKKEVPPATDIEIPEIPEVEQPEDSIPMIPLEPSIPVIPDEEDESSEEAGEEAGEETGEDEEVENIPVIPIEPSTPVVPEEVIDKDDEDKDIVEDNNEEDLDEVEPDPGPMGSMGRPQPGENWDDEIIEDDELGEDYVEICPPDDMFENWTDPDLVEPDPGPMGSMGRPQSPEEKYEWENPKTGDSSLALSFVSLIAGSMGLTALRRRK